MPIADRVHLIQNVRELRQRLLERQQAALQAAATPPGPPAAATAALPDPAAPPSEAGCGHSARALPGTGAARLTGAPPAACRMPQHQQRRAASRERRLARFSAVRELHAAGVGIRAIARQLGLARETVQQVVRADAFPERATRRAAVHMLDPYLPYLEHQLASGADNATQLWRDLREHQGFTGSRALVAAWVARHRHLVPTAMPK